MSLTQVSYQDINLDAKVTSTLTGQEVITVPLIGWKFHGHSRRGMVLFPEVAWVGVRTARCSHGLVRWRKRYGEAAM